MKFILMQKNEKKTMEEEILDTNNYLLYSCLNLAPKSLNDIIEESGMTMAQATMGLMWLELEGKAKEVSPNTYVRIEHY